MKSTITKFFNFLFLVLFTSAYGQQPDADTFAGLEFREIGTALTSGRIADIAIHPDNDNVWYIGVGSGGVWKTENSGTTWTPLFDKEASYSIGCVTIDPVNPSRIWVGTGENVGGRHVAFGDGVYLSEDEGKSWKNMGLKNSDHISKIVVHPDDSNTIWVASQGPLWSKGGERGVYKSTDGGNSWKRTLGDAEWVGATDILINPENPDILYAATWQRQRSVAALLGGGPGSGIHKSTDGGETWTKLTSGIPSSNLGKIGLAMSHFDYNTIYAAIELDRTKGGVYMSEDAGASWNKQSDAVSGGTGPHYYQELYASPHHEGRLYLMNNNVLISNNHGKDFYGMNEENKHVDSHAVAFKMNDPDYLLFGTDGGLYETFDHTKSWKYISNLPLSQYYKVAVDDSEPFYNIYGGTQDNGSHGGPSQTMSSDGITNADFWITLGADGHQSATEPGNPDITYGEFQEGMLWRIDQTTGETVAIQPQAREGDPYERFNWDAPILVSPHKPTRLYFASQRVWKSEDRGDSWEPISEDITLNQDRMTLPMYGKQQSWDNAWDVGAMSNYNTITSLAESPVQEGLLYAGTDDGSVSVSENGGESWRKYNWSSVKGVPATAFVNDVRADLFDANVAYAALDNHKYGDYKPYLLKTTDKGKSWTLINGNLPSRLLTWRLVQDHKKKDMLFAATEFGIYFTKDGGGNWIQLKGGLPTISFRDITIQRREDDLVGASFGRGFFILDNIAPLRNFEPSMMNNEFTLFDIEDADWYKRREGLYGQGDNFYKAENPPYGAVFTYYMPEKFKSLKEIRQEKETDAVSFAGWEALEEENRQQGPSIYYVIKDQDGDVVKVEEAKNNKGFNRVNWDLTYADRKGESLEKPRSQGGWGSSGGLMVTPGTYSVTFVKRLNGEETILAGPKNFNVTPLYEGAIPRKSYDVMKEFVTDLNGYQQDLMSVRNVLSLNLKKMDAMQRAANKAISPSASLMDRLYKVENDLKDISKMLNGDSVKSEIGERTDPTAADGASLGWLVSGNTYGPTAEHLGLLERSKTRLVSVKNRLRTIDENVVPQLEKDLKSAGAPYIEGQGLLDD